MKVALGLITKYINADISILDFVKNANKFGHEIDALIICYSHGYDRPFVEKLEREFPKTHLIKVNHSYDMERDLRKRIRARILCLLSMQKPWKTMDFCHIAHIEIQF